MFSIFQRHLYSTDGDAGVRRAFQRAEPWLTQISEAWSSEDGEGEAISPFNVLSQAIADVDSDDIRTHEIKLRPISGNEVPVAVICKLSRAFVESREGDKEEQKKQLLALAAAGRSLGRITYEVGIRAAYIELLIEEGDDESAIAAVEVNLSQLPHCPYSQYLFYQTLQRQKHAGLISSSPRVSLEDLSTRFCDRPFTTILSVPPSRSAEKGGSGAPELHGCDCAGMLPYPLASASVDSEDVWNGPEAIEIRRSILDGDFKYCAPLVCPWLVQGNLPKRDEITDPVIRDIIDNNRTRLTTAPRRISLAHDVSCNIACPTCRNEILTVRNKEREVMDAFVDRSVLPLLRDAKVDLIVSGDGDPIASKHYRRLLHNLDPVQHAGVGVYLVSNGLLITPKEWESLSHIHHLIKGILISIDAADKDTYEDVRRPGKWELLTSNMDFIAGLRRSGAISYFVITFVVQKKNFEQMPAFVELGQRWSVDRVLFSKLFGTLHGEGHDPVALKSNAVVDSDHPDHARFLEVLKNPILRSKEVDLFNITSNLEPVSGVEAAVAGLDAAQSLVAPSSDDVAMAQLAQPPKQKRGFWKTLLGRREKETVLRP